MKSVEERLRQLPEIADQMGLEAGETLKRKILRSAEEKETKPAKKVSFTMQRLVPVMCAFVLIVGAVLAIPVLNKQPGTPEGSAVKKTDDSLITTIAAGQDQAVPGMQQALDVAPGSIQIRASSNPSYRSIWARASGPNFPLIGVNGRYYRLLTAPTSVPSGLLGETLGSVNEYTSEPALAGGGIISNTVAQGETVYAIAGMNGAAVAARVNGEMRAFQRVSYGESALMGSESLASTLKANQVVALELTGVGTINDAETARYLMGILTDNASFLRSGSSETNQSLLIQLNNGITLQLAVNGERLMACGTWACPEFFEAFHESMQ